MYESSIARHFAERGRREGVEQGREEGRREGRREGHREGHREGREEGRMLFVLDVISARFGSGNAEQLKPTLESIQETTLFQQILVKASQVETFEELLHEVNTLIS
jgi:flagellar biosynthesis/type III secretory pathway protein FliH